MNSKFLVLFMQNVCNYVSALRLLSLNVKECFAKPKTLSVNSARLRSPCVFHEHTSVQCLPFIYSRDS